MDDQFSAGRVRPVVQAPAHVLSRPSAEVDPADPETLQLAADLVATMRVSPGCVGLAGPQIGVAAKVFALNVTGHRKAKTCHGLVVLANPVIESAEGPKAGREGCMSVPDFTGDVARAQSIVVSGFDLGSGEPVRLATDAFEATAFQHEIDHVNGLLFLDRVAGAHAVHPRKRYL